MMTNLKQSNYIYIKKLVLEEMGTNEQFALKKKKVGMIDYMIVILQLFRY